MQGCEESTAGVLVADDPRMRHLTDGDLAGWLDGGLDAAARRRVERHLDACDACRRELAETTRLLETLPASGAAAPPATGRPDGAPRAATPSRGRRWASALASLAAAAALAVTALRSVPSPVESSLRGDPGGRSIAVGEGERRIRVVAPTDSTLRAGEPVVLRWHAAPGETYRVTVGAENGAPIWRTATADTIVSLPDSVRLRPGAYFWRVEATSAGIVLGSGYQRFEVAP